MTTRGVRSLTRADSNRDLPRPCGVASVSSLTSAPTRILQAQAAGRGSRDARPAAALSCAAFAPPRALPHCARAAAARGGRPRRGRRRGREPLSCRVASLPTEGETTQGSGLHDDVRRRGANQAVIAARVGARVAMCARVGATRWRRADRELSRERIAGVVLRAPSVPTGVAQVTVDDKGANTIVVVAGANGELSEEDIETCAAPLIARAKVVVVQNESRPRRPRRLSRRRAPRARPGSSTPRRGRRGGAAGARASAAARGHHRARRGRARPARRGGGRDRRGSARPASSSSPAIARRDDARGDGGRARAFVARAGSPSPSCRRAL